jgi:hypothetical protein
LIAFVRVSRIIELVQADLKNDEAVTAVQDSLSAALDRQQGGTEIRSVPE